MVWQAICSCGLKSKAFITSLRMNSKLYIEECLEKRLLPFIRAHKCPVLFWPDLASCHYSQAVLAWCESHKVVILPNHANPPNWPEFRPIEPFWAIVKRSLKKSQGCVKDAKSLEVKWKIHAGKVDRSLVQRMMASIKKKVRFFIRGNDINKILWLLLSLLISFNNKKFLK